MEGPFLFPIGFQNPAQKPLLLGVFCHLQLSQKSLFCTPGVVFHGPYTLLYESLLTCLFPLLDCEILEVRDQSYLPFYPMASLVSIGKIFLNR